MGQCFGWNYGGPNRAPATRTNRRFEYTPKKSWKYKDSHMMTQFQALSMDSEEEVDGTRGGRGSQGQFSVGGLTSGSEDELYEADLKNTRNEGKLVFTDEDDEEEIGNQQPPKHTIINKGFQPLEDQSFDSPRMNRMSEDDKMQLLDNDTLGRDGVT